MTDKQFMERMIQLTEQLSNIYEEEPIDDSARLQVLCELNETSDKFNRTRRRRPWAALACCISLMIVLLYIVYSILCFLRIVNSQ